MKIYVASSWRNKYQQNVVSILRDQGYEVYDFRNPAPGDHGFAWSQIDPDWLALDPYRFRECLLDPIAVVGFEKDSTAVRECDLCVLVLPCGRSAHLEAGFSAGMGKPLIVYMPESCEPELMYSWARKIVVDDHELVFAVLDLLAEKANGVVK
jgi:hypothetical protein